jgi:hypothetical protein
MSEFSINGTGKRNSSEPYSVPYNEEFEIKREKLVSLIESVNHILL